MYKKIIIFSGLMLLFFSIKSAVETRENAFYLFVGLCKERTEEMNKGKKFDDEDCARAMVFAHATVSTLYDEYKGQTVVLPSERQMKDWAESYLRKIKAQENLKLISCIESENQLSSDVLKKADALTYIHRNLQDHIRKTVDLKLVLSRVFSKKNIKTIIFR